MASAVALHPRILDVQGERVRTVRGGGRVPYGPYGGEGCRAGGKGAVKGYWLGGGEV